MKFWKLIPNTTRIYLVIILYLVFLLFGLIFLRQWRESPDFLKIRIPFGGLSKDESSTLTVEAVSAAASPTFSQDTAWLRAKTNLRVFAGPGEEYPGIAWLEDNQTAKIIGKNTEGSWWAISLPYLQEGMSWVSANEVEAVNIGNVAVLTSQSETPQPAVTPQDIPRARAIANINIRSGPDLRYQKIGTLDVDANANILAVSPDEFWYLINVPGSEKLQGWISKDYVIVQNADKVPVLNSESGAQSTIEAGMPFLKSAVTVNVRAGPDVTYAVIGQLNPDQAVGVIGKNEDGSWWAIDFPGSMEGGAWVAAAFVKPENTDKVPVLKAE